MRPDPRHTPITSCSAPTRPGPLRADPNPDDVWRSADGVGWELVTDDVPWNDRANHLNYKPESEGLPGDVWRLDAATAAARGPRL